MIVYSSYLRTEDEFPSYGTTEEYAIKSADYQGGHTTTLVGCTKTVEAIDVGDCRIKITFIDPTVAPSRRTSQGLWTATAHEGGRFVEGLLDGGSLYLVAPDWRYTLAMAVDTATIRVTRETRDLLADQARERGVSLSAMLTELARDVAREAVFRSEREAARVDASNRDALREEREWEAVLGDGVG